jgi:hypothetical protein
VIFDFRSESRNPNARLWIVSGRVVMNVYRAYQRKHLMEIHMFCLELLINRCSTRLILLSSVKKGCFDHANGKGTIQECINRQEQ